MENGNPPPRNEKTLRTYDLLLPKFQLILRKFHFAPRWRIFVSHGAVGDFLGEELSDGHGNRAINDKKRGDLPWDVTSLTICYG